MHVVALMMGNFMNLYQIIFNVGCSVYGGGIYLYYIVLITFREFLYPIVFERGLALCILGVSGVWWSLSTQNRVC